MINPAPIPSELSLNAGGSRLTKDLPRNFLNSFTNRSKVEEQRRNTWVLKKKLARRSWPIEGDRGGGLIGSGSDSLGRRRSFGIGHELALISP